MIAGVGPSRRRGRGLTRATSRPRRCRHDRELEGVRRCRRNLRVRQIGTDELQVVVQTDAGVAAIVVRSNVNPRPNDLVVAGRGERVAGRVLNRPCPWSVLRFVHDTQRTRDRVADGRVQHPREVRVELAVVVDLLNRVHDRRH